MREGRGEQTTIEGRKEGGEDKGREGGKGELDKKERKGGGRSEETNIERRKEGGTIKE